MPPPSAHPQFRNFVNNYLPLSLEDQIASLLLATIYTSAHIDVTVRVGPRQTRLRALAPGGDPSSLSAAKQARLGQEAKAGAIKDTWAGGAAAAAAYAPTHRQQVIFRGEEIAHDATPNNVTESNFDTIAIILFKGTLYIAYNYKTRRMSTDPTAAPAIEYTSFATVPLGSMQLALAALTRELNDASVMDAEGRAAPAPLTDAVSDIVFVGLRDAPATPEGAAAPHAEMQLVSHLVSLGVDVRGLVMGVSKACCSKCAEVLIGLGVGFTDRPGNPAPRNWMEPRAIPTIAAGRFRYVRRLRGG